MAQLAPARPVTRPSDEAKAPSVLVLVDIAFPLEPQLLRAIGLACG